ncbi:MAG: DNA primase [Anaerolineales bacterium]|nr:DNA primase [Anaerolineales bacterium]
MSQVDEIKARIDIVDLVGESVKLRRAGKNYSGLCPFHTEKTPSFSVSPDRQTWRCFGQCNEGGDVFSFVMKKEGWDFKETLRYLAGRAGVELQEYRGQKPEEKETHERLRTLLEEAVVFYRHQLLNTDAGRPALEYLRGGRGLSDVTIEAFGLGYAPQGWDNTLTHFREKGTTEEELLDVGLLTVRSDDRQTGARRVYDRFRHRIMIPIRDERGRMAGFGARILDPNDVPKFLNSPETPLFSKSKLLYGLDRARKAIRAMDQAVIVEGYLDVIAVHQAGFENVVSPMGTALTEDQLRLLKRFTSSNRIVLALDPDAAGKKAVLSGLEAARQSLDREGELRFDARGLLRHEARLQADLRVASMSDELDPDEIVQRNPDEWKQLIEEAQPIVIHVMGALAAGRDLEDAKVKSEIAGQVLPLIEDLPDPIERDTYRQRLARFLKVDERTLSETRSRGADRGPGRGRSRPRVETPPRVQKPPAAATPLSGAARSEAHILGVLLCRPDLLYRLNRALEEQDHPLARMSDEDFGYTDHQELFGLVSKSLEQDADDPDRYLMAHLPDPLRDLVFALLEKAAPLDPVEDRQVEDLLRGVKKLRRDRVVENLNQVRFQQEEAQQSGNKEAALWYQGLVQNYTLILRHLDQARFKKNGKKS